MQLKSLLLLSQVFLAGASALFYGKDTAVINLTPSTFGSEIIDTNHTSIVEFYAEWCGHCQNLKPHYIKAASSLKGVVKVASVRCDDDFAKPLCEKYNIKGFPTIKVFRPNAKSPKNPYIEDYHGQRTAKAIVDYVLPKIQNRVKRLKPEGLEKWLNEFEIPKVLLLSDKQNTPSMLKSLAVDYADVLAFATINGAGKDVLAKYHVKKAPALVVINGDQVTNYSGPLKNEPIYDFLSGIATPSEGPKAFKNTQKLKKKNKKKTGREEL
ncbi:thioredoxin-like protein [Lipomyces japonicus]|uniref:thioredoxin-like protein n=1 Tax=Lipomyces japonicus TaxID=56871 RepID=UPI0034CFFD61